MKRFAAFFLAIMLVFSVTFVFSGSTVSEKINPTINISAKNISYEMSDLLYGAFLEDISYTADGGLVSNLVNNNSFEYESNKTAGWVINAKDHEVLNTDGLNENNTNYLKVTVDGEGAIKNNGYTELYDYKTYKPNNKKQNTADMGFKKGETYDFSAYFKNVDFEGALTLSLLANGNKEKYQFNLDGCDDWTKISLQIVSDVTADGAMLLSIDGDGTFYMDFASLVSTSSFGYDSDEWKYVSLRNDLYNALADLSPKFIRFPGGCLAEGTSIENLYNWKSTLGPLENRQQSGNLWRDDANGRYYINTNSMGYHEYFTLCDSLGAEPVPVVNSGIICQSRSNYNVKFGEYQSGKILEEEWQEYLDTIALRPGTPEFDAYLQDILDLIEYANGDETTPWGAVRAENGHKDPFNMKYIAIGNENWGNVYWRNFDAVYRAIKEKFPDITIITSSGHSGQGEDFDTAWSNVNTNYRDTIVDEHYYTSGGKLFESTNHYDGYERSSAKVMVGEYAPKADGVGTIQTKSNIWAAIENAAFLTGIERNSDVVSMIAYAPTFAKYNAQCWDPNLIWFTSQRVVLTPDYYVRMLFSNNYGTNYISTDFDMEEDGIYQVTTVDTKEQVIYVKLVNSTNKKFRFDFNIDGFQNVNNPTVQYMSETFKAACNEVGENLHVAPVQSDLTVTDNKVTYDVGTYSVSVIRIPYGENDGSALYELPETDIISPYIPPVVTTAISCAVLAMVLITGAIILAVRIRHHKKLKEEKE